MSSLWKRVYSVRCAIIEQAADENYDESGSPGTSVRVTPRDPYSIEIKHVRDLSRDRDGRHRRRTVGTRLVFFLPYSFDIRPDTYDPDSFFQDIKLYLRFNTPRIQFAELLDETNPASPLTRVNEMLLHDGSTSIQTLEYELRLLGAVVKSNLRELTSPERAMHDERSASAWQALSRVDDLNAALQTVRGRQNSCAQPIARRLELIDEHISLTVEEYLSRLLANASEPDIRDGVTNRIIREQNYRRTRQYNSAPSDSTDSEQTEHYVYRQKQLKRYATSVLFFQINRGNQAKRVEQLLYAIAAGIAMAVATAISFIGQIRFGSISSALFAVLVVAYMIKDRLKDMMRSLFHSTLGRFFFDRRTLFRDPVTGSRLGVVKERLAFVREQQLPRHIVEIRDRAAFEQQLLDTSPETMLEYTKRLSLRERRLHRIHQRLAGIADINIIDLRGLLRHLSDQCERVPVVVDGRVTLVEQKRIYHLNVVLDVAGSTEKLRLVVDGGGIRRIEHSGGGT